MTLSKPLAPTPNRKRTSQGCIAFALFLACLLDVPTPLLATPGDITTVAGGGGEQGPALSTAQVPAGVVVSGPFLYVADFNHWVVRRIDTRTGNEMVVAGTGSQGFGGDGGPATSAQLNWLVGVGVDAAGNLLIADASNNRVRKVDRAGTITTIAGTGTAGFSGDGGPASDAQLNNPLRVAVDAAGDLFIADAANQRIRKVDPAGTITTVAGKGTAAFGGDGGPATSAQLYNPAGVAVDAAGNLFIADTGNQRIRKVDPAGTITSVAGNGHQGFGGDGGSATSAHLNNPSGLAVDASGNLFIADQDNNRIRKIDLTGMITTVAGGACPEPPYCNPGFSGDGGPAASAQLYDPTGVAVDSEGNLFIADPWNGRVRKVDPTGTITTIAGNGNTAGDGTTSFGGDGGPAASAQLNGPTGVAADMAGDFFIADAGNQRIRKVDAAGTITTVAGTGDQNFGGDGGPATNAHLDNPVGVAVDATGNLFIADAGNNRIRKVDTAGMITTVAGSYVFCPPDGGCSGGFSGDGGPATSAHLNNPVGVAVDAAGDLFIADRSNQRIRKVDTAGTITTVAGNGTQGFSGDGGPATSAQLSGPSGVVVDRAGNLLIADAGNNRIRYEYNAPPDCCQCPASCAVPTNGSCGACIGVYDATCESEDLCVLHTPTPSFTPAPSSTPTATMPTRTPTPTPSNTPGENDCCQCADFCAAPIVGTCGGCTAVYRASCASGSLCIPRTPTVRPTPTPRPCVGDCNGDGAVTVDEVLTMVNIALGNAQPSVCPSGGAADIALIIQAVHNALTGCPGGSGRPAVTIETYPAVDGSTSTLPLARLIACELLGLSYRWQPWMGPEGESEIVPVATTPAQEALAAQVLERIVFNKTHQAYLNLVDGVADLITVANPPSPEERAYADAHGITLVWEPLALDALVIVLNASNVVRGLTTEQIQRIYLGELTNWSAVGGAASKIDPYVRPENSGSQQLFNTIVMQGRPMAAWPPDQVFAGMGGLIDRIRTDPLAIGYSVYYWVTYQYPTSGYSVIAVDGIAPTADTIGARSYPFTAEVWIVTRADFAEGSLAHQLHDWMLSPDGQKAVGRSGYVPIVR